MKSSVPSPVERMTLSWSYTLGLWSADAETHQALGEARAAAMARRRPVWLAAQAIGAMAMLPLVNGAAARAALFPWMGAMLGLIVLLAIGARRPTSAARATAWNGTDSIGGMLFGVGWAVALGLFTGPVANAQSFMMLVVAAALDAAAVGTMIVAPVGGLAFVLVSGAGAITAMAVGSGGLFAATVALVPIAIGGAIVANGRTLIRRIAAEQVLTEKEDVISLLLREFEDSGSDWLWRTDSSKRLIDATPRLGRLFGLPVEAIEGRPLLALLAGKDWEGGDVGPGIRNLQEKLRLRKSFRDLVVPVTVNGEGRFWSLSAAPRRDERGALIGFWGVGTDVTERQRSSEEIDRMARFDALTGLPNRAHVIDRLGIALRDGHHHGRRSALMLIDLDRFKAINDTLGHPVGDRLLIEVARRLDEIVKDGDLCGRLGGDEFALVVADASDRDRLERLAERIVAMLGAPYEIEGHRLHIGASVGSATAPLDGRAVETLLRNADLALYRAKDDGRGVHRRYEPQLHAEAEQRRKIEAALHDALELGQLALVYQPIVEAGSGQIAGFEALLRWQHPELGAISPNVFIPIAEEARLIGRIGDWVLHSACRDAVTWPEGVRVAINMAAAQLRDPQLAATIVSALSHSGLAASRLELEVTEEVFVRDGEAMSEVVDRILALGVRIALDDFGTGRSTLGYLRKGRFSTVKIDRSFVRGATGNAAESIAIVRAIVAMADSLGMTTIAEGAETRGEYDRMRGLGCRQIQGWQVGQPIDSAAAGRLASDRQDGRRVA